MKANKIYPRSFHGVVDHSVCYRVHDGKGKERRSLRGQCVCREKNDEANSGGNRTDRTTPAQGMERSGGGEQNQQRNERLPQIIYLFLYSLNHIMSANVKRLDPNKTLLLVCDIQVKFSAHFLLTRRQFADGDAQGM